MLHLFRKDIEKRCAYCKNGTVIGEGRAVCSRRGVVDPAGCCRHFRYDPLKRVPPRPAALSGGYTPEDFSL